MKYTTLTFFLILNGCTPFISAGGLMHSVITNNTVSAILGLGDTAIKEKTGKSTGKHLLDNIFKNDELESKNNKDVKWTFEKVK